MKIAVIANSAISLCTFRGPLLIELARLGHEVLAFAPDHDDASRASLKELGVKPVDCSMTRSGINPLKEIGTVVELRRLLRKYRPDICFAYFIKPVIYGTLAAWLAGVKRRYAMIEGLGFAFSEEIGLCTRRKALQRAIETLARFAMARVDRVIFLNRDDLDFFVDRKLVVPGKAFLLGGIGVDLADWPQTALPEGAVTFIMVARLLRDKGVREYVEAARILRRTHPDARFILVGGHDANPAAIALSEVESWVAEGLIEWPGHTDVRPWLAKADVFVLPSYREGLPRSTQEAMALGRPVVTTDVPGCRETVIDGRNGFLVPPRDPTALAAAMRRFLDDPTLIAPMGAESRRIAEERFDVHVQNRKLLECMDLN